MLSELQMGYIYRILAHTDRGQDEYQAVVSEVLTELIDEALDGAERFGLSRCELLESQEMEWTRIYDFLEDEDLEGAFDDQLESIIARRYSEREYA